jgi:IS30 family transposase
MSYRELDLRERISIQKMLEEKQPVSRIAAEIGRHRSTISREIRRNAFEYDELTYLNGDCGMNAQKYATQRRARRRKLIRLDDLRACVIDRLIEGWMPEQIAGRLSYDGQPARVSHETISSTIRILSSSDQCRRRPTSSDEKISLGETNESHAIRQCLTTIYSIRADGTHRRLTVISEKTSDKPADPQSLADRLRAGSKALDHDEIAARLAAIRQGREGEEQDKVRELERVKAEELAKEREAEVRRERGAGHEL